MEAVELFLGGRIFSGWESVRLSRSLEAMAGQFSLGVSLRPGDQAGQLGAGRPMRLTIGGETVITGYVDEIERLTEAKARTIRLSGRDKTGDLVDCAAIHASGQWRSRPLAAIAADLCRPFGVAVRWEVSDPAAAKAFAQWQLEPGETVYENLARAARHRGVLVTSTPTGELLFTQAGSEVLETALVLGDNLLRIEAKDSWKDRFSLWRLLGDSAAGGGEWGEELDAEQTTAVRVDLTDPAIDRYRPTVLLADDNLDGGGGQARVRFEQRRAMAHGQPVRARVQGWRHGQGLWLPNVQVRVQAPEAGHPDSTLLVTAVELGLDDEEGTVADLTLMPRAGFDVLAQPERVAQREEELWL
ncbi:hypothetical protein AN401_11760 [Zobellella denitrificans]|uniref:Phage tail protein n=1 Tax=Zobellella denitrificans TaxID=347534 RepID=A0A291HQB3_9GAMM|nr:contractile injection system protein, VgrG/Pvc8 family [Zobellella denitrificans]ATG74324.1 hypothetical protein AN401_11000 [Zobellella denitrificans]ATG74446.1 hypothetical protein AN401_11760 [Zobellella denitrificans]